MSARRAKSRGYTMIEVMAALGVLAIGATGVLALQKATLIGSTNARNLVIANAIAMTWAERLRADALQWNNPGGVADLGGDPDWIALTETQPFPLRVAPGAVIGIGATDSDVIGTDVWPGDTRPTGFCTQLRFLQFTDSAGVRLWPNLIRVEIRVFWERNGDPAVCTTPPANIDANPGRYGAVYLTTSVLRNTSEF